MTVDKVIAKIIWLTFLAHPVHLVNIIPKEFKNFNEKEESRYDLRSTQSTADIYQHFSIIIIIVIF